MARDFNGTTDFIEASSAVVSAYPLTMACWFNSDNITENQVLLSVSDSSDTNKYQNLSLRGADGGASFDKVRARSRNGVWTGNALSTVAYSSGVWQHATAIFTSSTSRAVFLGSNKGTDTTPVDFNAGIDVTTIGRLSQSTPVEYMNGHIADAAIWNVALDDAEVKILAAGYSPLCLTHRLKNLVFYQDLIRPLDRPGTGPSVTATGTSVSAHPRLRMPTGLTLGHLSIVPKIGGPFCIETADAWAPTVVAGQEYSVGPHQGEAVSTGPAAGEVNC